MDLLRPLADETAIRRFIDASIRPRLPIIRNANEQTELRRRARREIERFHKLLAGMTETARDAVRWALYERMGYQDLRDPVDMLLRAQGHEEEFLARPRGNQFDREGRYLIRAIARDFEILTQRAAWWTEPTQEEAQEGNLGTLRHPLRRDVAREARPEPASYFCRLIVLVFDWAGRPLTEPANKIREALTRKGH
ncbi:MAG: hypothetical protein HZB55_23390 [Deltaproteobacteria bacterium]|nr:hypothetical protein [Deltaproteobacteria bacterium]